MDFGLEFALKTTTQALGTRLLFELEENDKLFFCSSRGNTKLICTLGEKQAFRIEVVSNGKRL